VPSSRFALGSSSSTAQPSSGDKIGLEGGSGDEGGRSLDQCRLESRGLSSSDPGSSASLLATGSELDRKSFSSEKGSVSSIVERRPVDCLDRLQPPTRALIGENSGVFPLYRLGIRGVDADEPFRCGVNNGEPVSSSSDNALLVSERRTRIGVDGVSRSVLGGEMESARAEDESDLPEERECEASGEEKNGRSDELATRGLGGVFARSTPGLFVIVGKVTGGRRAGAGDDAVRFIDVEVDGAATQVVDWIRSFLLLSSSASFF